MKFWSKVEQLITDTLGESASPTESAGKQIQLPFACAILLVEIARSDYEISQAELDTIRHVLQTLYGQSAEQAGTLIEAAVAHIEELTSLHDFTKALDTAFSLQEKQQLVVALWQVAYADGTLDAHEAQWIKRLSDLLHVPRSFLFQCKAIAEQNL